MLCAIVDFHDHRASLLFLRVGLNQVFHQLPQLLVLLLDVLHELAALSLAALDLLREVLFPQGLLPCDMGVVVADLRGCYGSQKKYTETWSTTKVKENIHG